MFFSCLYSQFHFKYTKLSDKSYGLGEIASTVQICEYVTVSQFVSQQILFCYNRSTLSQPVTTAYH